MVTGHSADSPEHLIATRLLPNGDRWHVSWQTHFPSSVGGWLTFTSLYSPQPPVPRVAPTETEAFS